MEAMGFTHSHACIIPLEGADVPKSVENLPVKSVKKDQ
jgi:hypothetical protein